MADRGAYEYVSSADFTLAAGDFIRDTGKFAASGSNYEAKPMLQNEAVDAATVTAGALAAIAAAVWSAAVRTLTGFGTLVGDVVAAVWGAGSRSLTDKDGFSLSSAWDAAKTAAQEATVVAGFAAGAKAGGAKGTDAIYDMLVAGVPVSGTVVLDALQPYFAPAKPGDAMALTALYDAAKTAAQAGDEMTLVAAYDAAKTAAQDATVTKKNDVVDPGNPGGGIPAVTRDAAVKRILSMASGRILKVGNKYRMFAEDGTTLLFTLVDSTTSRERE